MGQVAGDEPRLRFSRVALWSSDGSSSSTARRTSTATIASANLQHGTSTLEVGGRSLTSLMEENGHHRIDLLKMDVEGAEYDVLESVDVAALGVAVLCVEFHATVPVKRARGHSPACGSGVWRWPTSMVPTTPWCAWLRPAYSPSRPPPQVSPLPRRRRRQWRSPASACGARAEASCRPQWWLLGQTGSPGLHTLWTLPRRDRRAAEITTGMTTHAVGVILRLVGAAAPTWLRPAPGK